MMGTMNCTYETPCGWCTKWDKKCDKKIGCGNEKPQRGLRAKAGIFLEDDTNPSSGPMSQSHAQEFIEIIKSGKLPPIVSDCDFGIQYLNERKKKNEQ